MMNNTQGKKNEFIQFKLDLSKLENRRDSENFDTSLMEEEAEKNKCMPSGQKESAASNQVSVGGHSGVEW